MALTFQKAGLHVIATARSTEVLSDLASQGITTLRLTVDSEESIQECLSSLKTVLGPSRGLDYLVHNAGRNYTVPALDIDMAEVRQTFETNLFGVMRITQLFTPLLIRSKGTIVMIGSIAGVVPYVFGSVYNASKAALKSYADTLRIELAPFDVSVISIITGGVQSNIARTYRELSPDSLYKPIKAEYERRQIYSQEVGMPNEVYAKNVVRQVLGKGQWPWRLFLSDARKKWHWDGASVNLVWYFCGGWVWNGLADVWMWRLFKLWKLKTVGDEERKKAK